MMDLSILLALLQDGIVNGAIYALLALALVVVFAVTRVIFIPVGEIVSFSALTYAALADGDAPRVLPLLLGLGVLAFLRGAITARGRALLELALGTLLLPAVIAVVVHFVAPLHLGVGVSAVLAIACTAPIAPLLYRIAFAPLAEASVLVLLIAAVGSHLAISGLGLVAFGPEGARGPAFSEAVLELGPVVVPGQALAVLAFSLATMGGLWAFFRFTLAGAALRATAINRRGARLVGIATEAAGRRAFWLAGLVAAFSGVLIAPLTTVYYDSGFLIGLKGFVAAIIGGLGAYPAAAAAAVLVGIVESFASFWASDFKEVIVFAGIIPVLLWRSLRHITVEDEE
jgi:branched-chain amino acid transport system permease protein